MNLHEIDLETWPVSMMERDQWITWKYIEDVKRPYAVYRQDRDRYDRSGWSDPDLWTDIDNAVRWWHKHPTLEGVGFIIQNERNCYNDDPDPFIAIDFDDVVDPETWEVHPFVERIVEPAGTYSDISTSKTGIHLIGKGSLSEGVLSIQDDLEPTETFPDPEIEVYDGGRFMAMTGAHVASTPAAAHDIQDLIEALEQSFETNEKGLIDGEPNIPAADREELKGVDETTEIGDLFDAIKHTKPRDIRLRSEKTDDGQDRMSWHPSWIPRSNSKSGTRLGYDHFDRAGDERWIYRDGGHLLDALQVVALEEGIISRPTEYPEGEAFWKAVAALRDRGANVPVYNPERGVSPDALGVHKNPEDEEEKIEQFLAELELQHRNHD